MGVFSRTMLMLTIVWLAAINVAFIYLNTNPEPDWRAKFISERNIRRAIAYRYVDIEGGRVPDTGTEAKRDSLADSPVAAESLGTAPYGLPDENGNAGDSNPLPGSQIKGSQSQIAMEKKRGDDADVIHKNNVNELSVNINKLSENINNANRDRRKAVDRLTTVAATARLFAASMSAYRYIIATFQQKVFNLDYEIQRGLVERDSLKAELAQTLNDIARIKDQQITLENTYYDVSRSYEQNVKIIGMYENLDNNIRRLADTAGRGWLFGRVRTVGDDPKTGVVTISIGSQDGVAENQEFTIHRDGQFVGRMRVEEVSENYAVGRLLPEFRGKVVVIENDSIKSAENFGGATIPNGGSSH